jgi:hypothetical protein
MAIQHWRHLYQRAPRGAIYNFTWPAIRRDSYVLITVAEAALGPVVPNRFIGDAKPMTVGSIAPYDGGVNFVLTWPGNSHI